MEYVSSYKSSSYYYGFHIESTQIPHGFQVGYIPWIPHGFHMEYVSSYKSSSYYYGFHIESTQIPHGFQVEHT